MDWLIAKTIYGRAKGRRTKAMEGGGEREREKGIWLRRRGVNGEEVRRSVHTQTHAGLHTTAELEYRDTAVL